MNLVKHSAKFSRKINPEAIARMFDDADDDKKMAMMPDSGGEEDKEDDQDKEDGVRAPESNGNGCEWSACH